VSVPLEAKLCDQSNSCERASGNLQMLDRVTEGEERRGQTTAARIIQSSDPKLLEIRIRVYIRSEMKKQTRGKRRRLNIMGVSPLVMGLMRF